MSQKMNCLNEIFRKRVQKLLTVKDEARKEAKTKIQRVSAILRGHSEKYYEPRWMSIGLIHHGDPKFQLAENYKLELAAKFIRDGGYVESWEELYELIKDQLSSLKDCFEKDITNKYNGEGDNESLNYILFFDGCAMLQFIHSYCDKEAYHEFKKMNMKTDLIAFTQHDLFLLENQIPYRVLTLLIGAVKLDDRKKILEDSINTFIRRSVMAPEKYQKGLGFEAGSVDPEPVHLLDLLRSTLVRRTDKKPTAKGTDPKQNSSTTTNLATGNVNQPGKKPNENGSDLQPGKKPKGNGSDLESQGSSAINQHQSCLKWGDKNNNGEQQSFRSVMDLKAAGIHLKPSETSSLRDIHFSSRGFTGTLSLPPLLVDDSTGSKFMNLIAYEMCPDNTETEYEVTSYIGLLDSLIDYPVDVKELRSSRILHNLLGCDQEVAQLFNTIATDLVPNTEVYGSVVDKIERHYQKKWMTWMAQVFNDHFSSPWTIVAFFAAALALGMSAVQTWFTIYSLEGPCDNFCQHFKKL